MDLADVSNIANENDSVRYLLFLIGISATLAFLSELRVDK
jgi:hypothetical protein